jgi:hypothetical protein
MKVVNLILGKMIIKIRSLVTNTELTVIIDKDKLIELNEKLDKEIIHFNYLKESIEIIAYVNLFVLIFLIFNL